MIKKNKFSYMKYLIIFISIIIFLTACSSNGADNKSAKAISKTPANYQLATVEKAGLSSTIKLPSQFAAFQEVSIFPKVNGYVKTVLVDIGSRVKKGDLLMELEAPELEQAVAQAREKYARAKTDYTIDKEHYFRLLEASETAGAVSPLDLSISKSKMEADSALSNSEKTNWQMQQTMQGYLRVTAPFDGVITERNTHPGALVSAEAKESKPMLELKEISHLRLQVDIPEYLSGTLKENDTISFYTSAFPGKKMSGRVSRKSMNINSQYRSERIEADVMNKDELLAPGMYADLLIYSKGNASGFTIPKSGVVMSTERKYVLVVKSGRITKVDVTTGNESDNMVEVFGNLNVGDSIIIHANDEIKEGNY
jgi:membrane fusion protein (multidrug efflux system)